MNIGKTVDKVNTLDLIQGYMQDGLSAKVIGEYNYQVKYKTYQSLDTNNVIPILDSIFIGFTDFVYTYYKSDALLALHDYLISKGIKKSEMIIFLGIEHLVYLIDVVDLLKDYGLDIKMLSTQISLNELKEYFSYDELKNYYSNYDLIIEYSVPINKLFLLRCHIPSLNK